jgi:malate dehydrogenase (oxaloacetate-decarboxylating)(NADP+)
MIFPSDIRISHITVTPARRVTDGMFLDAAKALAQMVTPKDLEETAIYPRLTRIRECSHAVACATAMRAVKEGYADEEILEGLEETVRRAMCVPEYLPIRHEA